jgi:hypothetical protein
MFWLVQLNSVELLDAKTVVVAVETGAVVCATDNNVALAHMNPPPFVQHDATFSAAPQQLLPSPTVTREDIMCQWSRWGLIVHPRLVLPLVHCEAHPEPLLKL